MHHQDATAFNPYLHARLSEVIMLRDTISKMTNIEEVFHVASAENIADICTRKESNLSNLRIGSTWQTGPSWLREPRYSWPCTRNFTRTNLPDNETRDPIKIVLAVNLISDESSNSMVQFIMSEYWTFSEAACSLAKTIQRVKMVRGIFLPYSDCLIQAKTLMFEEAMGETERLITAGKLKQFSIESK